MFPMIPKVASSPIDAVRTPATIAGTESGRVGDEVKGGHHRAAVLGWDRARQGAQGAEESDAETGARDHGGDHVQRPRPRGGGEDDAEQPGRQHDGPSCGPAHGTLRRKTNWAIAAVPARAKTLRPPTRWSEV